MSTTSGSVSPPLPSEAEAAPTSSAGTVPLAAGAAVAAEAVLGSTGAAGAAEAVEAAEEVPLAVPDSAETEAAGAGGTPHGGKADAGYAKSCPSKSLSRKQACCSPAASCVVAPESGEHNRRPLGKGSESMAGLWP